MTKFFFLGGLILLVIGKSKAQGPIDGFMKGKNETDFALTYSFEKYNKYYLGDEVQDISITTQTASLFVAHGFSKTVNLIASIPFIWNDADANLQDAVLAIKYRGKYWQFKHGDLSKITSFGFSFPISNYDKDIENPIGQRATIFSLRQLYQYKSYGGFFIHLQSGFDFRVIPQSQIAIPLIFRLGYGGDKIFMDVWLDTFHTLSSDADTRISGGEGAQYVKIGGTFYYAVTPKFGAFIGGAHFMSGRNVGKASRLNVGMVYKQFKSNGK